MTNLSRSELIARLEGDILSAVPDDNDMQHVLSLTVGALEEADRIARLHEEATENAARVRAALDRADARFAARENGAVILADFYMEVKHRVNGEPT